jgi:hypothetical protein
MRNTEHGLITANQTIYVREPHVHADVLVEVDVSGKVRACRHQCKSQKVITRALEMHANACYKCTC